MKKLIKEFPFILIILATILFCSSDISFMNKNAVNNIAGSLLCTSIIINLYRMCPPPKKDDDNPYKDLVV